MVTALELGVIENIVFIVKCPETTNVDIACVLFKSGPMKSKSDMR